MSKEKKQMVVLGVLALLIVGVGAFQFLGPKRSSEPVVENETSTDQTSDDLIVLKSSSQDDNPFGEWTPPETPDFLPPIEKRDPFKAQAIIIEDPQPGDVDNTTQTPDPPVTTGGGRPTTQITGGGGEIPWQPDPGEDLLVSTPLDEPPYYVAGIIQGSRSTMAILSPEDGPQRIVSVGDKVGKDKDMTIVAISANEVEVIYKGKKKTLNFRGGI